MRTGTAKQPPQEQADPRPSRHMWTFEPDEDVYIAMEEEMQRNPHAWKNRSELINECIREALAENVANAIERKIIAQKIAELMARSEALKDYASKRSAAAQDSAGEQAFYEAKRALRSIYKRKLS